MLPVDKTKEILIETIFEAYEKCFRISSKNNKYQYVASSQDEITADKFSNWIFNEYGRNSISTNFILSYTQYQFDHYVNGGMESKKFNSGIVLFNWVFGNKAIQRWVNESEKNKYKQVNNKKDNPIQVVGDKKAGRKPNHNKFLKISHLEEREKQRYHNTDKGLGWCIETTTLYNHSSMMCFNCIFKGDCKELLKENYEQIYKKRGYE